MRSRLRSRMHSVMSLASCMRRRLCTYLRLRTYLRLYLRRLRRLVVCTSPVPDSAMSLSAVRSVWLGASAPVTAPC